MNAAGLIAIDLKHPILVNGVETRQIQLKRPKVKHLKAIDGIEGDVQKTSLLLGQLSGLDAATVDSIDAVDFAVIAEIISGFFG